MIDWLYQTTLSLSILIGLVLFLRKPVSQYLGANVTYWLWLIPIIHLTSWHKQAVPIALIEKVDLVDGKILLRVIDNPTIYSITSLINIELLWISGLGIIKIYGLVQVPK